MNDMSFWGLSRDLEAPPRRQKWDGNKVRSASNGYSRQMRNRRARNRRRYATAFESKRANRGTR